MGGHGSCSFRTLVVAAVAAMCCFESVAAVSLPSMEELGVAKGSATLDTPLTATFLSKKGNEKNGSPQQQQAQPAAEASDQAMPESTFAEKPTQAKTVGAADAPIAGALGAAKPGESPSLKEEGGDEKFHEGEAAPVEQAYTANHEIPDDIKRQIEENSQMAIQPFWHRATGEMSNDDITMSLQISVNLIDYLPQKARSWRGPISVAVLVPNQDLVSKVEAIVQDEDVAKYCDIHVCVGSGKEDYYPINRMRNNANCRVRTDWMFVMDADEDQVFPHQEYKKELMRAVASSPTQGDREIYALSSFQWLKRQENKDPTSKEDLLAQFGTGSMTLKHSYFPKAYTPSVYSGRKSNEWVNEWAALTEAISMPPADCYEPYHIVKAGKCSPDTPHMYDERFVGWGANKAIHLKKLMMEKYHIKLLPNLFTFVDETKSESQTGDNMDHEKQKQLYSKLGSIVSKELGRKYCQCDACSVWECHQNCPACFSS